ncbi:enoyl-CoA hydratase/isomerase family protein [Comamonas endophytica]|uniref:enoyl-CoA hydratase/isomerase family protein n=1 Tax=Comamonas endophytica TaxID=2949090 RepID=UPI00360C49CC
MQLHHPGKRNAMSVQMWHQLRAAFASFQGDQQLRCILIEGSAESGEAAFCAGGDISEYPAFRFDPAALRDFHENAVWGGLSAMLDCEVPIVAAIAGACMGAGVEIAACADLRLAAQSARFGAPIARLGFPMAPREAALVATAAGALTARQMLLEAATFSAAEMAQRGFVGTVVEDAELPFAAHSSARRIAALAPQAARRNKQILRALLAAPLAAAQQLAGQGRHGLPGEDIYAYADGAEHREGIAAFLAKRAPVF